MLTKVRNIVLLSVALFVLWFVAAVLADPIKVVVFNKTDRDVKVEINIGPKGFDTASHFSLELSAAESGVYGYPFSCANRIQAVVTYEDGRQAITERKRVHGRIPGLNLASAKVFIRADGNVDVSSRSWRPCFW